MIWWPSRTFRTKVDEARERGDDNADAMGEDDAELRLNFGAPPCRVDCVQDEIVSVTEDA